MISREIESSAPITLEGVMDVLSEYAYDVTILSGNEPAPHDESGPRPRQSGWSQSTGVDGLALVAEEGSETGSGREADRTERPLSCVAMSFKTPLGFRHRNGYSREQVAELRAPPQHSPGRPGYLRP